MKTIWYIIALLSFALISCDKSEIEDTDSLNYEVEYTLSCSDTCEVLYNGVFEAGKDPHTHLIYYPGEVFHRTISLNSGDLVGFSAQKMDSFSVGYLTITVNGDVVYDEDWTTPQMNDGCLCGTFGILP